MVSDKPAQDSAKERRTTDWFREAWSQALVAVNVAEEEAGRLLHRAGELAGWRPDDARRYAKEFGERLAAQRKDLERTVDERIGKALSRMKIPKREEIEALSRRVSALTERIQDFEARRK